LRIKIIYRKKTCLFEFEALAACWAIGLKVILLQKVYQVLVRLCHVNLNLRFP